MQVAEGETSVGLELLCTTSDVIPMVSVSPLQGCPAALIAHNSDLLKAHS